MPDLSNYHCTLLEAKIICEALESKPLGKDAIVNVSLAQDPPPTKFSVNVTAISAFTHYTCVATIKNKEEESSKESEAIKFSTLADGKLSDYSFCPESSFFRNPLSHTTFTL